MNNVTLIRPEQARGWSLKDGSIVHDSGRYFSIVSVIADETERPMIIQPEKGTLGWLRCGEDFLVQHKWEPGNISGSSPTSTLQATQSNLDRVHGGMRPDYACCFEDAKLIDQSEHGSAYLNKVNRNGVVEIGDQIVALNGFSWLWAGRLLDMALRDFGLTTDGRSALVSSNWADWMPHADTDFAVEFWSGYDTDLQIDQSDFKWSRQPYKIVPIEFLNQFGSDITWVRVETTTRETPLWCQPLLSNNEPSFHDIYVCRKTQPMVVGFDRVHEIGLDRPQFSPATSTSKDPLLSGHKLAEVWQCDEGGRFYKHVNCYRIFEVPVAHPFLTWMTAGTVQRHLLSGMAFTNEARTSISVLLGLAGTGAV